MFCIMYTYKYYNIEVPLSEKYSTTRVHKHTSLSLLIMLLFADYMRTDSISFNKYNLLRVERKQ